MSYKTLNPKSRDDKFPNTSSASKFTQHKTSNLRIKDEIRYLYTKKTATESTTLTLALDFSQLMEQLMALYPTHN
jgi:hypothetical protein